MKNKWIKSTGLVMLAMVMVAGLNAQARNGHGQGYGPGSGQGFGPGQCPHARGDQFGAFACLDLSEEQQEQLKTLRLEHYNTMKPLRNQMEELRLKKRNMMSEDEGNINAIHKVIDEQTALSNKMQKLAAEYRLEAKSVLSNEQVMKIEQRRQFERGRHGLRNHPARCQGPA